MDIFAQSLFVNGRFSFDLFYNLFASTQTRHLLLTSLSLAGLVTLLSLLVGLPLGILLGKSDIPGRPLLITVVYHSSLNSALCAGSGLVSLVGTTRLGVEMAGRWRMESRVRFSIQRGRLRLDLVRVLHAHPYAADDSLHSERQS